MKNLLFLMLLLFLFAFTNCEKDNSTSPQPDTGSILFQYYYENYAWGYVHNGFLIDSSGVVHVFSNPDGWNFHSYDTTIQGSLLNANLIYSESVDTIEQTVLKEKLALVSEATTGELYQTGLVMCDGGISCYYAYTYNSDIKLYTPISLYQGGDFEIKNTNTTAQELADWLASIWKDINEK